MTADARGGGKRSRRRTKPRSARRVGYGISLVVFFVSIWVASNLVEWGWPSFLTEEWNEALPFIIAALGVSIVLTVVMIWFDPKWFRSLVEIITSITNLVATLAVWRIWPFEFSEGGFPWETIVRVGMVIGIITPIIAIVLATVKLVREVRSDTFQPTSPD